MRIDTFNQKIYLSHQIVRRIPHKKKKYSNLFSQSCKYNTINESVYKREKEKKEEGYLDLTTLLILREEKQCVAGINWIYLDFCPPILNLSILI